MNPRRSTPGHIIIKMSKIKNKEQISKTGREKQLFMYKENPRRLSADFFSRNFVGSKRVA